MPQESFASVAENAPALLWRGDADGRCVYLNRALREFWGVAAEDVEKFTWVSTLVPEDAHKVFGPFSVGMRDQTGFKCEARYLRADGEIRILETLAQPHYNAAGEFLGMVGVNVDVTDGRIAQKELAESEARLRALAENLPYGMTYQIISDADGARRFSFVSNRCETINGIRAEDAVANPALLYGLILEEDQPGFAAAEEAALAAMLPFEYEARMRRPGGEPRWFSFSSAPRRGTGDEIIWDGFQVDIQDRKAAEQRQQLLVDEMNHRVKNTLMTVLSIASQTSRTATSLAAFSESFQSRLRALSKTHDLLTRECWESADLREVLESELLPYAEGGERKLKLDGPKVRLSPRAAVSLSLVIHELVTNAAKYGAYSGTGAIDVLWSLESRDAGERVVLTWTERGGPVIVAPAAGGFGTRLIAKLAKGDLDGDFHADFKPAGLEARLRFAPSPEKLRP